jgi:hypothetical protein
VIKTPSEFLVGNKQLIIYLEELKTYSRKFEKQAEKKKDYNAKNLPTNFEIFGKCKMYDFFISNLRRFVQQGKYKQAESYIRQWCPLSWALKEFDTRFHSVFKLNKPMCFREKGVNYINNFPGMLHQNYKPYKEYSAELKEGVELMWTYIKEIWCSDKNSMFFYVKNWICQMVSGWKIRTLLYLKGP